MAIRVSVFAVACALSSDAWAQRATGPFAGLFDGQSPATNESLTLRWTSYGGYDDLVRDQLAALLGDEQVQRSGDYKGATAGLIYRRGGERNRFTIGGNSGMRSYRGSREAAEATYAGAASLAVAVSRTTIVRGFVIGSYAPFYQFAPFLAGDSFGADSDTVSAAAPAYGFAAVSRSSVGRTAGIGLTQSFSPRATLAVDAGWRDIQVDGGRGGALASRNARFMFREQLTRNIGLHAGYGYEEADLGAFPGQQIPTALRGLDIGLDYSHPLSVSRRTTIAFGTGSTMARSLGTSQYLLNGRATLSHEMGRTWTAAASFDRGAHLIEGFREPFFSNAFNVAVGGLVAPRVELTTSAGYVLGNIGQGTTGNDFTSYTGSARLVVGVSRLLGVFANYTYYKYGIPPHSVAGLGVAPSLERQAVVIGLSGWVPIIQNERRRDTR